MDGCADVGGGAWGRLVAVGVAGDVKFLEPCVLSVEIGAACDDPIRERARPGALHVEPGSVAVRDDEVFCRFGLYKHVIVVGLHDTGECRVEPHVGVAVGEDRTPEVVEPGFW